MPIVNEVTHNGRPNRGPQTGSGGGGQPTFGNTDTLPNWFDVGENATWKGIANRTGLTVQQLKNRNRWVAGSEGTSLQDLRGSGQIRLTQRPEQAGRNRFKVGADGATWMELSRRFNIPVEKLLELNGIDVGPKGKYKRRIDAGTRVQLRPGEGGKGTRNSLDPWQRIEFQMQRMNARDTFDNAMADVADAREMGGLLHTRTLDDLTRTYDDSRRGITPSMARRGLLNSGVRTQAIQDMADAFAEQRGDVEFAWGQQNMQWDNAETRYNDQLQAALDAIRIAQQAARTQAAAANIGTGA